jgi:fluoroquinolone transport system permease protein
MHTLAALAAADLRSILRDTLLSYLLIYPLILGLLLRWLIPFVRNGLADTFDITPYYLLLAGFFGLLITPALSGLAIGLLLLDERDDRTLRALQVTPMSVSQYLSYRLIVPILISVVATYIVLPLTNLIQVSYVAVLPVALLAAAEAPIFALFLAAFAANKVQGFALMKATGILMILPFLSWWIPEPWQWFVGVFPTFWPMKTLWLLAEGRPYLPAFTAGFIVHMLWFWPLLRRFKRVSYDG